MPSQSPQNASRAAPAPRGITTLPSSETPREGPVNCLPVHKWSGTAKELLGSGLHYTGKHIAISPQDLGYKLKKLDDPLLEYDGIVHYKPSNGKGGGKHTFYYQDLSRFRAPEQQFIDLDPNEDVPF